MSLNSYDSLDKAIRGCFGDDVRLSRTTRMLPSDINSTKVVELSNGKSVFLKCNSISNASFFDAEEDGINAMAKTGAVVTPKLYCKGTDKKLSMSFLMMELIDKGTGNKRSPGNLGQALTNMHLADASEFVTGGKYGFISDNYIGATKQINTPKDSWIDFFRECRLEPQFRMASKGLTPIMKDVYKLLDRLDDLLIEPEHPSLLHGDMWGGNHLYDRNGGVVLIDPAVYVGHSEADIAMTEMFTPFPRLFYDTYYSKIPRQDGFADRKDIYNLYHYLNHYNLFGDSYLMSVKNIVLRY